MKSILETVIDPLALSVCFQPIFDISGGAKRIDSLEALIRGPRGTRFSRADVLFDYVRRKRAEAAVDRSCLAAICHAVSSLPLDMRVNINVHAVTLGQNSGFVEFLKRHVKEQSLRLDRFTLEIVEHAPTCNVPQLTDSIIELRDSGVRIALDDVGLGQSNYRMMLDCHPQYFKLDAYFVRGLAVDSKRRAVVESLVALAETLDSAVVAEGASSEEDLVQLAKMDVDLVQANILCPAMPLEELQRLGHLPGLQVFNKQSGAATKEHNAPVIERHRTRPSGAAGQSLYT
jgi:EAL domain-containing protein (putative c-di-GMP-specific phosphodiesterase class I)